MSNVKNIPIILVIIVLSVILGYAISFLYRLIKVNIKVAVIVMGLVLIAASMYRLKQLNESNDGFLGIGKLLEVFFYGSVGGGLLVSIVIKHQNN